MTSVHVLKFSANSLLIIISFSSLHPHALIYKLTLLFKIAKLKCLKLSQLSKLRYMKIGNQSKIYVKKSQISTIFCEVIMPNIIYIPKTL